MGNGGETVRNILLAELPDSELLKLTHDLAAEASRRGLDLTATIGKLAVSSTPHDIEPVPSHSQKQLPNRDKAAASEATGAAVEPAQRRRRHPNLTSEETRRIEELYGDPSQTLKQVAAELGISPRTISKIVKNRHVTQRNTSYRPKLTADEVGQATSLYISSGMTVEEIARQLHISRRMISRAVGRQAVQPREHRHGRPPALSAGQVALAAQFYQAGLPLRSVADKLSQEMGIRVSHNTVWRALARPAISRDKQPDEAASAWEPIEGAAGITAAGCNVSLPQGADPLVSALATNEREPPVVGSPEKLSTTGGRVVVPADNEPLPTDPVAAYLREIGPIPMLSPEEETILMHEAHAGNTAASERLVEANLRLVVSVAKRYAHYGLPLIDIIQEGNIGLKRASEEVDPGRGARFGTYAHWRIRQAIGQYIRDNQSFIRIPVHINTSISRMHRTARQLAASLGYEPTKSELAAALEVSEEDIEDYRAIGELRRAPASLDQPLADQYDELGENTLYDVLSDPVDHAAPTSAEVPTELQATIKRILSPREWHVLSHFYGLDGVALERQQIANLLGVNQQSVRRILKGAEDKIRTSLSAKQAGELSRTPASVDQPLPEQQGKPLESTLLDVLAYRPYQTSYSKTEATAIRAVLHALARQILSPREWHVLSQYFGLEEGTSLTLQQIADPLHVTRQGVHKIKEKAVTKLLTSYIREHVPSHTLSTEQTA